MRVASRVSALSSACTIALRSAVSWVICGCSSGFLVSAKSDFQRAQRLVELFEFRAGGVRGRLEQRTQLRAHGAAPASSARRAA